MRGGIVGDGPTPVIVDKHVPQRRRTGHVGIAGHDVCLIEDGRGVGQESWTGCERTEVGTDAYQVKKYRQEG